ncbi:uncharacterized protein [Antedon mediterranea]|uniref:uncharacterized protein n=1 Tax=Antedon mediterranea TaxID=105859 RepID=UPI003AF4DD3D
MDATVSMPPAEDKTNLSVAGAIIIGALCGVCVFLIFCLIVMAVLRKRQQGQQQRAGFVPRRLARLVSVHSIRRSSTDHHHAVANSEAPPDYNLCMKIETELNSEKETKLLKNIVINRDSVDNIETMETAEISVRNDENRTEIEVNSSRPIIDEEPPNYNHVQRNTSNREKFRKQTIKMVDTVT